MLQLRACHRCGGDLMFDRVDDGGWSCLQCGWAGPTLAALGLSSVRSGYHARRRTSPGSDPTASATVRLHAALTTEPQSMEQLCLAIYGEHSAATEAALRQLVAANRRRGLPIVGGRRSGYWLWTPVLAGAGHAG